MFNKGDVLCSKYRLEKQFNKGGFSQVWLAHDLKADRDFALKIYAADGGMSDDGIDEFREEFNLVVNLNHSNIFKPLTYDIHDSRPFLVMPYCINGSAAKLIGHISEDEAWRFAHDVAAGLAYLHEQKDIVHQDIKPGNILIDDDGKYMITDFGISTKLGKTVRTSVKQALEMQEHNYGGGTPEYMGPERWPREGYVPPVKPIFASDIWSLGATLFELMTGSVPFRGTGGAMQLQTHSIPDITGNYSKALKDIVFRCMSEKPWERPSAQELVVSATHRKLLQKNVFTSHLPKKAVAAASLATFAVIVFAIYMYLPVGYIGNTGKDIYGINDSLFLAQVYEASTIVLNSSANPGRDDDAAAMFAYAQSLSKAGQLYQKTMTLDSVSDEARQQAAIIWTPAQDSIDSAYLSFQSQQVEYAKRDATEVADTCAKCSENIIMYISDKLK